MEAYVIGGSGLVGRSLVEQLLGRAGVERVVSVARRRSLPTHPKLEERVVEFDELERALAGQRMTHAFSCLGTTIGDAGSKAAFRKVDFDYPLAFGRAARASGARAYLLVSALGASSQSYFFYNRVKGEVEAALGDLGFPTLHIAQPSLLLGERARPRFGERVAATLSGPFQGMLGKYAPIAASDVATALMLLAEDPRAGKFVHPSDELVRLARAGEAKTPHER